jgi:hypothetical protein
MSKFTIILTLALVLILSFPSLALASPESDGKNVSKHTFIHYKSAGKPGGSAKTESSYSLYKGGVKWDVNSLPVSYKINVAVTTENSKIIQASFKTWDDQTSKEMFSYAGTTTNSGVKYNHENTISWISISQSNIIAMTSFWVNNQTKQIVEFDIEFNNTFAWSTDGSQFAMDVQNIATHEIGHTLVLNDLYQNQNSNLTMYGYSWEGDTGKRSLETGDIAGLKILYGN